MHARNASTSKCRPRRGRACRLAWPCLTSAYSFSLQGWQSSTRRLLLKAGWAPCPQGGHLSHQLASLEFTSQCRSLRLLQRAEPGRLLRPKPGAAAGAARYSPGHSAGPAAPAPSSGPARRLRAGRSASRPPARGAGSPMARCAPAASVSSTSSILTWSAGLAAGSATAGRAVGLIGVVFLGLGMASGAAWEPAALG